MSYKNRGAKLPPFTAIIRHTTKSDAWQSLSVGARATFFVLQTFYNTKSQDPVFLSARDGAKELSCRKENVGRWLDELEHYGFTVKVKEAHRAGLGKGSAATYRLTDRWCAGKPPTYDYDKWDGTLFEPKRKAKSSKAEIARLNELKESRRPVSRPDTSRLTARDIRAKPRKAEKVPERITARDIRDDQGCITVGDISMLPSAEPSSAPSKLAA